MLTNAGIDLSPVERSRIQTLDDAEGYIEELIRAGTKMDFRGELIPGKPIKVTKDQKHMTFDQLMELRRERFPIKPIAMIRSPLDGEAIWIFPDVVQEAFDSGYLCHSCWEWQSDSTSEKCDPLYKNERWRGCGASKGR